MMVDRKGILFVCSLVLCFLARAAFAQEAVTADDVQRALDELERASRHERTEKMTSLVEIGQVAVSPLIAVVEGHQDAEDANYTGHCILALGELKARESTDALIDVLDSASLSLAYWSAMALGEIWEDQTGADAQVKRVNAALLALLYSDLPPVMTYGPGLALISINRIPVVRPTSKTSEQLLAEIDRWLAANADSLPPAEEQPWQLNLRTALTTQDAATQQDAIQALRQKRELGPVKPILDVMAGERSVPASVRDELAKLLGELTGVTFPPELAEDAPTPAAQVEAWRVLWFKELRQRSEPKYINYCWSELENALRRYATGPSEVAANKIKYFRAALIYQLPDPEAIPASATPNAKTLLSAPLEIKKKIGDAVAALESGLPPYERASQLSVIEEQLEVKYGQDVGGLFPETLARLAYDEDNLRVAAQIGKVLTKISGVPCNLDHPQREARLARLDEWTKTVGIELPGATPSQ